MALSNVTLGGWLGFAAVVALGIWLIVGRERWTRDVYQPPLWALGRVGRAIPPALGALLIIAAGWTLMSEL